MLKISLNRTSIEFSVEINGKEEVFKYLETTTKQLELLDSKESVKERIEVAGDILRDNISHQNKELVFELINEVVETTSLFNFKNQLDIAINNIRDEAIKKSLDT